ncbi:hypothetical protein [Aeoliella sp.]|uniref:hypothetical protein n=1 Tax=Aeoliella sp. TaxID=2795800 RepID=UPI003CCB9A51
MTPDELKSNLLEAIADYKRLNERLESELAGLALVAEQLERMQASLSNTRQSVVAAIERVAATEAAWCDWLEMYCGQDEGDWWREGSEPPEYE